MLSWLIVVCLLAIALCRAAPPMAAVVKAAIGVVTYPPVPTRRAEGDGVREDAGLPEDPDQRGHAQVVRCTGRIGLRVCAGWRDAANLTVAAFEAAGVPGI
jgi:hypothetical protein